ncbi:TetR/AcrR family transcriptional regulator [Neobacillus niacini]|uniref:TetR/AcrR family transcriptional regulator n=1 Tax=Neobacillus niacini TaxID=86668 RepID=UPI0021CB0FB6|nr:TetR/AcrR family transcriptional regulator [Neobacillus niacini]MCM3766266.1 TetR/AcrR family transcriptional regulator [Neobacillus niacini]
MSLREKKAVKKKEEILKSAVEIMAGKGYHAVTVEEVASRLLMTKGSVYYYFNDKEDLLYQSIRMLMEQTIDKIRSVLEEEITIVEKLKKAIVQHTISIISERSGFSISIRLEQIFTGRYLEELIQLREEYSEDFDTLLEKGMEEGLFISTNVKVVRNLIFGAMNGVVQWYSQEGEMDKKEFAEMIANHLLRLILKSK